jgi:PAS domain S-box-containing protein
MTAGRSNRTRLFAALALTAVVALVGLWLRGTDTLVPASYDSLHKISGEQTAALADSPVVIVYLDLNSFQLLGQNPARPLPRALHAQLLRRLTAAGARAVVFDIVFSAPGVDETDDADFADALRASGRTILAGESSGKISAQTSGEKTWTRSSKIDPPLERFATNAAAWGIASHMIDDDYVVRRYLAGFPDDAQPSLTWATAVMLKISGNAAADMAHANRRPLRYYGPPTALPHVAYEQALAPDGAPENFFRDKIVFVGARPITQSISGRQDEFRSPFHSWANQELFMPGVEVHATEMLNLVRGDWLRRLPARAEIFWLLLVAGVFGGGLVGFKPIPATFIALAGGAGVLAISVAAFARGVWFPWLIVVGAQVPVALFGSWLWQFQDWFFTRRKLEAAKRIADAKIREQAALIDKAHDAILVQALDGKIIYANSSAEKLFGWNFAELQRANATQELFSPDAEAAATARATVLREGEWNGELRPQTKAGRLVIVASRWTLIRDEAGAPRELLLINSDITEQKSLEAQFLRTQRMNTIGALAGGMAHDLNNALSPIMLGVQLLRRTVTDPESANLLSMMETNTHRSADMVKQVLMFARGRSGEFEQLPLAPIVKELEKMVRETFPKNIKVEKYLPSDLWLVRGNPTQLHQVLLNLCVNARDAMPEGGTLTFAVDNVTLDAAEAVKIPEGRAGEFVSLLVSDSGTGMPPEVVVKIFEPFFTTKGEGKGTGIGLATVLRIVKAHEGFLRVESAPGEGTTFEVFLPRAMEAAPAITETKAEIPRGSGELILVVDAERAVRELVHDGLTAQNYRVLPAANGEEALELFKLHRAEVRLLLVDFLMTGMSGAQTIAAMRAEQSALPIILVSAESAADVQAAQLRVQFLRKPFSLDELLVATSRALTPLA